MAETSFEAMERGLQDLGLRLVRDYPALSSELRRLVTRVAEHDRSALASFYDLTSPWIFGLVLALVQRPDEAEEITGRVYLRIWHTAKSCPAGENALTWALRSARGQIALQHPAQKPEVGVPPTGTKP